MALKYPEVNIDDWNIVYWQEPYKDRFFIITHKNNNTIYYRFNMNAFNRMQMLLFPFELRQLCYDNNHFFRFLDRVKKYNRFLDEQS